MVINKDTKTVMKSDMSLYSVDCNNFIASGTDDQ